MSRFLENFKILLIEGNIGWVAIALLLFNGCALGKKPLTLISGGKTDYVIVLPVKPTKSEKVSAWLLQEILKKMTGVNLPVEQEDSFTGNHAVFLGKGKAISGLIDQLKDDGYAFEVQNESLIIGGNQGLSTEYGVYAFAEKYFGCRKLDREVAFIPRVKTIKISGDIHEIHNPAFLFRQSYYPMSYDTEYLKWQGLQRFDDLWGIWGHSFFKYVPPQVYFNSHPEYYSLVNGYRRPLQLCLSNTDVLHIVIEQIRKLEKENPDVIYWSVSPNDGEGYCTCPLCRKADIEEGGPQGSLIRFVNKVAAALPELKITTLAYGYTAHVPLKTKPVSNVFVFVSSIDAFREKPLNESLSASSFRKNLIEWLRVTPNVFVWDYSTQFTNYLAPFPVCESVASNHQFFRENKVRGVFEQGSGETYSDMAELNSYVQAKLLWNPDEDVSQLISSFCHDYYGPGAGAILKYLERREEALLKSNHHLDIYGNPINEIRSFLSPEQMDFYNLLLDQAVNAVKGTVYESRVRRVQLSLEYVRLQQSRYYGPGKNGFLVSDGSPFYRIVPDWPQKVFNFVHECKDAGVKELSEGGLTPEAYQEEWNKIFNQKWLVNLALNAKISLTNPFVEDYSPKGARTLVDGMSGFNDFSYNWLCFYGTDMVALIDMNKKVDFQSICMNFLDDPKHWIFLPESISIELSDDGIKYHSLNFIANKPETEHFFVQIVPFQFKSAVFLHARYVRVTAKVIKTLPSWRLSSLKKPMLCCDEVYVTN